MSFPFPFPYYRIVGHQHDSDPGTGKGLVMFLTHHIFFTGDHLSFWECNVPNIRMFVLGAAGLGSFFVTPTDPTIMCCSGVKNFTDPQDCVCYTSLLFR